MAAKFHEQEAKAGLKGKRRLSAYLDMLAATHLQNIKKVSLNYIFCTDELLLAINKRFLDHDTYTDIITFDMSDSDEELVGEIYISVERVRENAGKFATTYADELHRVIFHGALHLCGFKDKKPADRKLMREQEEKCLREYGQQA